MASLSSMMMSVAASRAVISSTCSFDGIKATNCKLFFSSEPITSSSASGCEDQSLFRASFGLDAFGRSRSTTCAAALSLFETDFYHIPYTEGVPVGSKLKLFNLPCNCDEGELIKHFATCGATVQSIQIVNNLQEGNASGYVVLEDLDQACAAVAQLDGAIFQGKCVRMDFVTRMPIQKKRHHRRKLTNKLYIGNLPWRVDDATLQQLFSALGNVQKAQVIRDRINGRSRGYGFVLMSTSAEVMKAIAELDGCEIEGRPLKDVPRILEEIDKTISRGYNACRKKGVGQSYKENESGAMSSNSEINVENRMESPTPNRMKSPTPIELLSPTRSLFSVPLQP